MSPSEVERAIRLVREFVKLQPDSRNVRVPVPVLRALLETHPEPRPAGRIEPRSSCI